MNKKTSLILISSLVIGLSISIATFKYVNEAISVEAANEYTVEEFATYLEDKKEHYPLSDEFIERYQQASGGYIDTAKKNGVLVDKYQHSPNQKWHFMTSWYQVSLDDGSLQKTDSAKKRIYNGLKCPELLLWIFEAMGADNVKIRAAKKVAEEGRVNNQNVGTIASNMRECVTWDDVIVNISKEARR